MTSTTYSDAITDALDRLDDLGYERAGQQDLANHGPMGAEALAALGHAEAIPAWVTGYRNALAHNDPPSPWFAIDPTEDSSWRPALGAFDRVGDWEALFRHELDDAPWRDVLVRWWPRLLPGLFSRLTHGPIRTAHAVRSVAATSTPSPQQITELARGLAYWAARFTTLPGHASLTGRHTVAEAVAVAPRTPVDPATPPATLLRERLSCLPEQPGYTETLRALRADHAQALLSTMTAQFAGLCLTHTEYTPVPLIHGVTAPAALRLVLPYLPTELHEPTLTAMWQTHTALLFLFAGNSRDEENAWARAAETEVPGFDDLIAAAVEHGDEHVIKFTDACLREHLLRPDPRYPAAVLAVQHRIPRRSSH